MEERRIRLIKNSCFDFGLDNTKTHGITANPTRPNFQQIAPTGGFYEAEPPACACAGPATQRGRQVHLSASRTRKTGTDRRPNRLTATAKSSGWSEETATKRSEVAKNMNAEKSVLTQMVLS
jgi:hypothetical protein